MKEIWKDIPDYEGYYQISNFGRVKRSSRTVTYSDGRVGTWREKIMSQSVTPDGYHRCYLWVNNKRKTCFISSEVAVAFLNHKPNGIKGLVVDHINHDKSNNRVDNLRLISNEENVRQRKTQYNRISGLKGVGKTTSGRWCSRIMINKKNIWLGTFDTELEAHEAYQTKLASL